MGLLPAGFRFSQASLSTGEGCLRRFYLRYLRRLNWPAAADAAGLAKEAGAARGRLFHHLVLQHSLGLEVEEEVQAQGDPVLARWWHNFLSHPPLGVPEGQVYSEIELWVPLGPWRLRARFDRVVVAEAGAVCIVDWKTGASDPERLLESWQTLVYCFAACEGGVSLTRGRQVDPGKVSLCYWQAERPAEDLWYRYSSTRHREARTRIENLVQHLAALPDPEAFTLTQENHRCAECEFRAYCGRGTGVGQGWESEPDGGEEDQELALWLEPRPGGPGLGSGA